MNLSSPLVNRENRTGKLVTPFRYSATVRVPDDDSEWSTAVSEVLEVGFQLLEWPQPLLQLIHRAEISCEVDGRYELVIVLRVEIIREP
jgi:hypothetical protein